MQRPTPVEAACALRDERYPESDVVLLAGSVVRAEATTSSDLDLVVLYRRLSAAHRESFTFQGWPVEAFVHDAATLAYFFEEVDRRAGRSALAHMVADGLELPRPTAGSRAAKAAARRVLDAGPPPLSADELQRRRYLVTDLLDDLRAPRSAAEQVGTGATLHGELAELVLRARSRWSARGKQIPRALRTLEPRLADRWERAFGLLFRDGDPGEVIALAEELLAPLGGRLFDGFRLDAPASWRALEDDAP